MYDTLIIGAGMSGLAAGIRLAHYDERVCILERHYTIGGLNSFYRLRGRDYDVGLHAVTNFTPKGTRTGALARLLRQLRFRWDDFALAEQVGSEIAFPEVRLRFSNDFALFESEIAQAFPGQQDNFRRLVERIVGYDDLDQQTYDLSTREILAETIDEPMLREMILTPVMAYGNPREHDMDFGPFCVLFRAIYLEGLARPHAGIRLILKNLVRRFRGLGGELLLRHGVARIEVEDGRVAGVVLDDGTEMAARRVLSSAGRLETLRLCGADTDADAPPPGRLSFAETVSVLDCQPKQAHHTKTMVFFNDSEKLDWRRPDELLDHHFGVVCSPNNFLYSSAEGELPDGLLRVTTLANFDGWSSLSDEEYRLEKLRCYDSLIASAVRFVPDFRSHVIDGDMFTPKTIRRFTGHEHGAVYGAARKRLDGATPVENLYLCGADQGYGGIIGAMTSGVIMANRFLMSGV